MDTKRVVELLENCIEFDDLYDVVDNLEPKEKGDIFELITYYLFKLCPTLNGELQSIWLYKDIPTNIIKELKLPSKDKGIDLLAKIQNEYCAIQCKFRQHNDRTISWRELATFFGLSF